MRKFQKTRIPLRGPKYGKNPQDPIRPWPYNHPLNYKNRGGGQNNSGKEQPSNLEPDENGDQEIDTQNAEPQDADLSEEANDVESNEEVESEDEPESEAPEFSLDEPPARQSTIPFFRQEGSTTIREFPSWYDFVTCAADNSLQSWMNSSPEYGSRCRSASRANTYYATDNFEQAVDMAARTGWPEGRALMYECLQAVRPHPSTFKSETYEVAGPIPIIPIYIAGDPACMQDWQHDHLASNKIVTIEVSAYYHAEIKAQTVMQRGAAILSLCHSLEQQGYSVEILTSSWAKSPYNNTAFYSSIAFKPAGEPIDIDRAAFALAHPSTMRRLMFAIIEQSPELKSGFFHGMGSPQQKQFLQHPNTIYIPGATQNETLEQSRAAVEIAAQSFLQREDLAA